MKLLTPFLTAAALLWPVVSSAADFEGKIKMTITEARGTAMPVSYAMKSGLMRVEMETPRGPFSAIIDNSKQEMIMIMDEQKMYMVQSLHRPGAPVAEEKADDTTVEKTNEHEKILGYDTTKYVAKSKGTTTEVWATDQLGAFGGLAPRGGPMGGRRGGGRSDSGEAWEKAFRGKEAFPLRVTSKDAAGKQTFTMEVTAIEKQSLPASLFQPPEGYQKFDMGAMMQGMPGMGPGGMRPPGK